MSGANSFGNRLVLTTFGESHGPALGAVIDGVPSGVKWDEKLLQAELDRRRPGSSRVVSARNEADRAEVLSGVYQGRTLGTPIGVIVRNHDARSSDYAKIARKPRRGHADDVWKSKFGHSDPRGGGRSSGRETLSRVIGGAIATMILRELLPKLKVTGFATSIGPYILTDGDRARLEKAKKLYPADEFVARFPSAGQQVEVEKLLVEAKSEGLSYGGLAELWVDHLPAGLGQPVFHKLRADLASAFLSVGATSYLEIGDGAESLQAEGSKFHRGPSRVYGGMRGGISTGERLVLRVGFKPTSSVLDVAQKGRHDPCIVPRAIPVLEAMLKLVLVDHLLWQRSDRVL